MGFFPKIFKKMKNFGAEHEKLLFKYDTMAELLYSFNLQQASIQGISDHSSSLIKSSGEIQDCWNNRQIGLSLYEIFTSASALSAASYVVNTHCGIDDIKRQKEMRETVQTFFDSISVINLKALRSDNRTSPIISDQIYINMSKNRQQQKSQKYCKAIRKVMEKGSGTSIGLDICHAVTEDLYGEPISDVTLSMKLFSLISGD